MPIEKPQHVPPQDFGCPLLRIAKGCTHGACRFCSIYAEEPFATVTMKEIISDIEAIAKTATPLTRRIYLTGGNPFSLPTERLIAVFDEVERRIPSVSSYGGFCRIMDIANKSDEELALLAHRGVSEIAIGAESGFDEALAFMEKGHTAADIAQQGKRLHQAKIPFTFFYLAGMAGAARGEENAIASARAFSQAGPNRILIVCMTPTQAWPLADDIQAGRWTAPTEREMAHEIRTFIEHLDCPCMVNCSHDTDIIRFEGMVPQSQQKMLELLDNRIPLMRENAARLLREQIHKATF